MAENEKRTQTGSKTRRNPFRVAGHWLWDNKFTILGSLLVGAAGGVGGTKLLEHRQGKKPPETPPTV